jgi:hypothetical protein
MIIRRHPFATDNSKQRGALIGTVPDAQTGSHERPITGSTKGTRSGSRACRKS